VTVPAVLKRKMLIVSDAASCAAVTRRQLGQILTDWGCSEDLVDDAKLVATELVTNGMLHGGGCTSLAAIFDGHLLRLEVGDRGGAIPQEHHYDDEAATGRGLNLIAALSSSWGWEIQVAGKIVWAEIGQPANPPGAAQRRSPPRRPSATSPDDVLVRFSGVPVADYLALQEHNDALYRDVDLVLIGSEEGLTSKVPEELLRLVQEMRNRFGPPSTAHRRAVEAAAAAGQTTVDLEEWVSESMVESSQQYVRMLERIEAYAGRDYLLIARPAKELVTLRRWFAEQVAVQTGGDPCIWP
jgi:anti-sigma regulatory factor (Ser/Thr protein kinase)